MGAVDTEGLDDDLPLLNSCFFSKPSVSFYLFGNAKQRIVINKSRESPKSLCACTWNSVGEGNSGKSTYPQQYRYALIWAKSLLIKICQQTPIITNSFWLLLRFLYAHCRVYDHFVHISCWSFTVLCKWNIEACSKAWMSWAFDWMGCNIWEFRTVPLVLWRHLVSFILYTTTQQNLKYTLKENHNVSKKSMLTRE